MTDLDSLTPSQDERVMAALAQISILVPFLGVIAPIFIWVTQKDKSPYVAFQSLQAVAFQLTMVLTWFLFILYGIVAAVMPSRADRFVT